MSTVAADPAPGKGIVLFDGHCPFCRLGVRILGRLDWLHRLHMQNVRDEDALPPEAAAIPRKARLDEMHLLTPDRKHTPAGLPLNVRVAGVNVSQVGRFAPLVSLAVYARVSRSGSRKALSGKA